jgi:hypothetical protein
MPQPAASFLTASKRGFRNVYELRLGIPWKQTLSFKAGNHPPVSRSEAIVTGALPQTSTILACLGQAAFVWDIASDTIIWSDHVGSIFSEIPAASLSSGAELAKLIEPKSSVRS